MNIGGCAANLPVNAPTAALAVGEVLRVRVLKNQDGSLVSPLPVSTSSSHLTEVSSSSTTGVATYEAVTSGSSELTVDSNLCRLSTACVILAVSVAPLNPLVARSQDRDRPASLVNRTDQGTGSLSTIAHQGP